MKSERETLEKLEKMSNVNMSSQKQQEIWDNIEKEIDDMKPVRVKRYSSVWGTGAAAVAAVAVLAGGIYTFTNHGSSTTTIHPGSTTATNNTGTTTQRSTFPSTTSIQTIAISSDSADQALWTTQDPKSVINQVIPWLDSSKPYTGQIPASQEQGVTNAYVGPAKLHLKTSNQDITIYPAFYRVKGSNGTFQDKYVQNVVVYDNGQHAVYLASPQLYTWLKADQWKTEFAPSASIPSSSYSSTQLANMTATQLADYSKKHPHNPLPFASKDITRNVPKQLLLASNPKSGSMFGAIINVSAITNGANHSVPNIQYKADEFQVIDHWTGSINGKGFEVEVDKKKDGSAYIVGVANGPIEHAYSFSKQPYITNFTGSYMVFATPSPANGNPYFAINLTTGKVVQNAMDLSQYWETMGGYSGSIVGLSKSYSSLPSH